MVDTSGGVGDDCHDAGGNPVAGGGGHLGDGVCQLGGGTGAGQDEGECDTRLHSRHKLPSVFVEGPLEAGGSGRAVWARQHGNMAGRGNSRFNF